MRTLRQVAAAAMALALAGVAASGVGAQEPSPEPPPWFGGRVEMPEHGFAVTLPDDWVGFDLAVDAVSQLEAASSFVDSAVWSADDEATVDEFTASAVEGFELWIGHAARVDSCGMGVWESDMSLPDAADLVYETTVDTLSHGDVELPQSINLPAGPAYHIRWSGTFEPDDGVWRPSSRYVLESDGVVLMTTCTTNGARPDDDWLFIAETIEFPPAE